MSTAPSPTSSLAIVIIALAIVFATTFNCVAASGGDVDRQPSTAARVVPGKTLTGKATIYPNVCNGRETASGETFHQTDHTAASNKLPLGTDVKVTNLKTGKTTAVTVTDRGPALGTRRIDLSKKAAKEIGLTPKQGIAPVKIKVMHTPTPGGELAASSH